ncbi:hypothetical protein V5799_006588 [Amblyomma americanum]|uniref:CHCH domain-containing protein n=1 Tax=Amblyomma americanum TaxID=6943 RepID=A0AAQ4DVZ1_AMBAM
MLSGGLQFSKFHRGWCTTSWRTRVKVSVFCATVAGLLSCFVEDVACLPEMMTLFSCLAEKNYDSNNCSKEVKAFQGCFDKFLEKNAEYRATGSLGILTPGLKASQLTSQQANTLLKKYPLKNLLKKIR